MLPSVNWFYRPVIIRTGSGKQGVWAGRAKVVGASIPSRCLHWNNKEDKKTSLTSSYDSPSDWAPSSAAPGEDVATKSGFKERKNHTYLSLKHKNVVTYNRIGVKLLEMDPSKCLLTSSPFDSPLKNTLILSLDKTFTCEPLIDLSYDLPLILITWKVVYIDKKEEEQRKHSLTLPKT